jgi:hypothetical protein
MKNLPALVRDTENDEVAQVNRDQVGNHVSAAGRRPSNRAVCYAAMQVFAQACWAGNLRCPFRHFAREESAGKDPPPPLTVPLAGTPIPKPHLALLDQSLCRSRLTRIGN